MPIFGSVAEKLILSRFVNVFGMLYASGITVVEGLRISRGAMGNKFLSRGMDGIIDNIINGATLFKAFNESGLFPPLVLRMIRLGETTGGVDSAMIEIKNYFDKDAEEAIETAQEAINPIMMLIVAGLLIWVVAGRIWPALRYCRSGAGLRRTTTRKRRQCSNSSSRTRFGFSSATVFW